MPQQSPGKYHCETKGVGWVNGVHPATPGEEIDVQICFESSAKSGVCRYSTTAKIRNCGDYYLYNFKDTPTCYLRYCGTHAQ